MSQLWRDGSAVARARWYFRHADEVGSRVRLLGHPRIINEGRMIIGERARFDSTTSMIDLVTGPGAELEIEKGVFINVGTTIGVTLHVRIGAGSQLGPQCMLMDNAYHHVEPEKRFERPPSKPIVLGPNVWLGARAIVFPGVTIGEDACIGAYSVVTRDVPPRTFAAGSPARVIRDL